MNTNYLIQLLSKDHYIKNHFQGVFAADKIPIKVQPPVGLVINTDISSRPGKHWLAVYIDENFIGYYFDSYGYPIKNNVKHFFKKK
jgi:ribosomal protein S19